MRRSREKYLVKIAPLSLGETVRRDGRDELIAKGAVGRAEWPGQMARIVGEVVALMIFLKPLSTEDNKRRKT